jgi:hypothetical protein
LRVSVFTGASLLLFFLLPLYADESAAQPGAGSPANAAATETNVPAVSQGAQSIFDARALEKRIRELESEVVKLWNYINATRRMIPGDTRIGQIADRRATELINRFLAGRGDDATRLPSVAAAGGVAIAHIVVGNDRGEETLGADGLRIALVVRGPRTPPPAGRVFIAVYALPHTDLVLRPEWLIHVDDTVPYIDGSAQTHFVWQGNFENGTRAAAGNYHIFVRAIVGESEERNVGSAMRYWGSRTADGRGSTVIVRE